jgi:hypothetical protein
MTVISVFFTSAHTFSFKQLLSCTHEAEWTPFQTHHFWENLVTPGTEPWPLDHRGGRVYINTRARNVRTCLRLACIHVECALCTQDMQKFDVKNKKLRHSKGAGVTVQTKQIYLWACSQEHAVAATSYITGRVPLLLTLPLHNIHAIPLKGIFSEL